MNLLIKGGKLFDPEVNLNDKLDILIEGKNISRIGRKITKPANCKVINLNGELVLPGFIDMHVHFREPGRVDKETILTGAEAALKGGFTAVAAMGNTSPPVDDVSVVEFYKKKNEITSLPVYPVACISKGQNGKELTEMMKLKESGAVAFSDDGKPLESSELMRRALEYSKITGLPIISHCEDKKLSREGVMHEGYWSTILGLEGIPSASEEIMVARDLLLAEFTGGKIHLAHISTARSIELIKLAKKRKINVTAEAAIHHLILCDSDLVNYDTNLKVNPPLGTKKDVTALINAIKTKTIDCIVSDHAPHTLEEKDVEFNDAPFGISGVETLVPLLFTELVFKNKINLKDTVYLLAKNPAKILNLPPRIISEGAFANLTIIDTKKEKAINKNNFVSMGKNTPFHGKKVKGIPVKAVVNGKIHEL